MIYLGNHRNLLRDAILSATNVVPSQVVFRLDSNEKVGGGHVTLAGDYTGANDATYDIEITNGASSTPRTSQPVPVAVGNGTMTDVSATGLGSQQITVTLFDLGTETRSAFHPFQGVMLYARQAGDAGNNIVLSLDTDGLVNNATDYATQGTITVGSNEYAGQEWDFGARALTPEGKVPADAPRIRFGFDPQVYRAYKTFVDNQWTYGFSPKPVRDVPRGTPVYRVTGSRTVTITNGVTTDTLPNIVTAFDCLRAINSQSTLVRVEGVVADDRTPGGQGATELSVWTQPYVVSIDRSESEFVQRADLRVRLGPDAPTQRLVVRCRDSRTPGAEVWSVVGDVSGLMPSAVTGIDYASGGYRFNIPVVPNAGVALGQIMVQFRRPSSNAGGSDPGWRGPVQAMLGAAARTGHFVFTYRPRPPEDCEEPGEMSGGPNADCLGITPPEDTQMSQARLLRRRQRLSQIVRVFMQSNTSDVPVDRYSSADQDIEYMKRAASAIEEGLVALEEVSSLPPPARQSSHDYAHDEQMLVVIGGAEYRFAADGQGTSAGSSPDYSAAATLGATVTDGSVVFANIGKTAISLIDELLDLLQADSDHLLGIANASVTDDTAQPWAPTTLYPLGTERVFGGTTTLVRFRVTDEGTSGSDQPNWATVIENGDVIMDGTVEWTRMGADSSTTEGGTFPLDEAYTQRYISAVNEIKAAAGLSANFDNASTADDGCWRDSDQSHWFEFDGDEARSPFFPNVYYHASRMEADEAGNTVHRTTKEFSFGAKFGCPEALMEGDQIIIDINVAGTRPTYQEGDEFRIQSTRATPIEFSGGQTGTDELTWSVDTDDITEDFDDYVLDISDPSTPNPYSHNGLGFTITQGAIKFALGDRFTLAVESAQYRTRKNGGAWSAAADIPATPAALSDGLSIVFAGGRAPSWSPNDRWTFRAEATNGVDQLRRLTDGRLAWAGSTTITVAPSGAAPIEGVMLAEHAIPEGATITLQGSDDDFSTTPLSQVIPWRAGCIWSAIEAEHAKYRITINQSGSLSWVFLGEPFEPTLAYTHTAELGTLVKRHRLPNQSRRAALGGTVAHEGLSEAAEDGILALLAHATEHDDGRFGIVPNPSRAECSVVAYVEDSLEISDVKGFQPADPAHSLRSLSLDLVPIP